MVQKKICLDTGPLQVKLASHIAFVWYNILEKNEKKVSAKCWPSQHKITNIHLLVHERVCILGSLISAKTIFCQEFFEAVV